MPNSQRVLFTTRGHGVFGGKDGDAIIQLFLDDPFKKMAYEKADIVVY
jgi:hypothetical protein